LVRKQVLARAKEYIKEGQVEVIAILPTVIQVQVGEYRCTRKKMRGYSIDTCQCEHHSRHPGGRCAHKDAMVTMLVMSGL